MSDITETMTVKNGQAAVKTVTVAGKLSPKTSATDTIALVETSDGKQAALKVYNINGGGGGGTGGDYLPLSGGTMTGTLSSSVSLGTKSLDLPGFTVERRTVTSVVMAIGMSTIVGDVNKIRPYLSNSMSLGDSEYKWSNVFTAKINNGADIAIPTEGGTMARIEDINAAVGDISTALTAILGE